MRRKDIVVVWSVRQQATFSFKPIFLHFPYTPAIHVLRYHIYKQVIIVSKAVHVHWSDESLHFSAFIFVVVKCTIIILLLNEALLLQVANINVFTNLLLFFGICISGLSIVGVILG